MNIVSSFCIFIYYPHGCSAVATGAGNIPWSQLQFVVSTQALADHSNPFAKDKPQVAWDVSSDHKNAGGGMLIN
jgi:hypothetical protein